MFSALQEYANQNRLIGFLTTDGVDPVFTLVIIDSKTEKFVTKFSYKASHAKMFIDEIQTCSDNLFFKAFIIDLFELPFGSDGPYDQSYSFCEELRKIFAELKIPSFFIYEETYVFSSLLIAAKIEINYDETVLIILPSINTVKESGKLFCAIVAELKYTPNGFELIKHKNLESLNSKENPEILRQKICGTSKPQKVIACSYKFEGVPFKKIFKSMNLIVLMEGMNVYREKFVIETCKWLFDKSYIKYHILPTAARTIRIYGYYGTPNNILNIINIQVNDPLPIKKIAYCTKSIPQLHKMFGDKKLTYGSRKEVAKSCHGFRVTVTIDEENFHDIETLEWNFKDFRKVPSEMNALLESKIPFIAFYDNSSIIGVYDDSEEEYKFLDEWNGMFGNDCFISFDQKKPKFGQNAIESFKTKNTFVVFDLLNIMSMPSDNIKIEKTWGFTFTKDANNPVLLEFDNFDGSKKCSSPAFLMAIDLRQHLKAIEEKIGEKPKEIAFWIIDRKSKKDEKERIESGLQESCRLLKIDCCFVELEKFSFDSTVFKKS